MKGPAIFLAQFAGDEAPFNELSSMVNWVASLGYKGVQIPTWDTRLFDLERAATSKDYCDEIAGICADAGVEISELSTHLQGQLVAAHPAYGDMFDAFAPEEIKFTVQRELPPCARELDAAQRSFLGSLADRLDDGMDGEAIHRTIWDLAQTLEGVEPFRALERLQSITPDDVRARQAEHFREDSFAVAIAE